MLKNEKRFHDFHSKERKKGREEERKHERTKERKKDMLVVSRLSCCMVLTFVLAIRQCFAS